MNDMPRRAVVTGASGFIGTALLRHLRAGGWTVVAVDRRASSDPDQSIRQLDVAQAGALDGLLDDRTVIFHMAASADVAAPAGSVLPDSTRRKGSLRPSPDTSGKSIGTPSSSTVTAPGVLYSARPALPEKTFALPRAISSTGSATASLPKPSWVTNASAALTNSSRFSSRSLPSRSVL